MTEGRAYLFSKRWCKRRRDRYVWGCYWRLTRSINIEGQGITRIQHRNMKQRTEVTSVKRDNFFYSQKWLKSQRPPWKYFDFVYYVPPRFKALYHQIQDNVVATILLLCSSSLARNGPYKPWKWFCNNSTLLPTIYRRL